MTTLTQWTDLSERLERAVHLLGDLRAAATCETSRSRIEGKRQGVLLAIDYMRSYNASRDDERDALVSLLRSLLHEPYVDEDGVVCVKRTTYGMGSDLADIVRPLLNGEDR